MQDKATKRSPEEQKRCLTTMALLTAVLVAWALFALWTVQQADHDMRSDLLQHARMVTQAMDVDRVQALKGTEEDRETPYYRRLKEQFIAVRMSNPQCRFLYLMGRRLDGTVFFFLDSEWPDSKDYSPPGQIYAEVSTGYRRVFDTKAEDIVGPVTDRWGRWVSALVPIYNPQTGDILAVLGMDVDANTWNLNVAYRAALPVSLMLVLLLGVFFGCRLPPRPMRPA